MNLILVRAEWQRARQALGAAAVLRDAGYLADALSRAYYATLHAAKAALYVHDVATASHAAMRRMFGLHLIQSGAIETEWASHLAEILDDRLAADYDVEAEFTAEEVNEACQQAQAFLDRVRRYLLANDVTADDLRPEATPPS
jgi:uncharacterized protein (UPF0332 family)